MNQKIEITILAGIFITVLAAVFGCPIRVAFLAGVLTAILVRAIMITDEAIGIGDPQ